MCRRSVCERRWTFRAATCTTGRTVAPRQQPPTTSPKPAKVLRCSQDEREPHGNIFLLVFFNLLVRGREWVFVPRWFYEVWNVLVALQRKSGRCSCRLSPNQNSVFRPRCPSVQREAESPVWAFSDLNFVCFGPNQEVNCHRVAVKKSTRIKIYQLALLVGPKYQRATKIETIFCHVQFHLKTKRWNQL